MNSNSISYGGLLVENSQVYPCLCWTFGAFSQCTCHMITKTCCFSCHVRYSYPNSLCKVKVLHCKGVNALFKLAILLVLELTINISSTYNRRIKKSCSCQSFTNIQWSACDWWGSRSTMNESNILYQVQTLPSTYTQVSPCPCIESFKLSRVDLFLQVTMEKFSIYTKLLDLQVHACLIEDIFKTRENISSKSMAFSWKSFTPNLSLYHGGKPSFPDKIICILVLKCSLLNQRCGSDVRNSFFFLGLVPLFLFSCDIALSKVARFGLSVILLTLRPRVLAFFIKFWDETDRVFPENWPFSRLKALLWIPCN